jgi:hypothetical protein
LINLRTNVIDLLVNLLALFLQPICLSHDAGDTLPFKNRGMCLSITGNLLHQLLDVLAEGISIHEGFKILECVRLIYDRDLFNLGQL